MTFTYIFGGERHHDTTNGYMAALGMSEEQIKSTLLQQQFEIKQLKAACVKWRDGKLKSVIDRIEQHERDSVIDEQYKTSATTGEQYLLLLEDRKALCDYPSSPLFPYCERPVLIASA
ncbi:hypothetical protein HWV00_20815 (plasmid) [Moritella sp. 24]|uniref:hypothetical protein n=1 Tax=Moritella sp. 24 TaxID=2746230 RepID=UPI001BA594ED|nr:hypothetical protein [Moritella sp. 24]QUM78716.1 hypothetical protein HWV00_20815 [Moritella sp. 24]